MASPFAFGYEDELLTSTAGNEILCCNAGDEGPLFIHAMAAEIRGVRNVGRRVLAVDAGGTLVELTDAGEVAWRVELGVEPLALAATPAGRWAVVYEQGALVGSRHVPTHSQPLVRARAAAFHEDGRTLALASADSELWIWDLDGERETLVEIGAPCRCLAWSTLGWWIVASDRGLHRVEADGSAAPLYLPWGGEPITSLAISAGGGLAAFVTGERHVAVFGVVQDFNCGAIQYYERSPQEVEFGPGTIVGVGLGLGDGNKVDLAKPGAVWRTDPPEGRVRNSWLVASAYDPKEVELALRCERAFRAGQIVVEGRGIKKSPALEFQELYANDHDEFEAQEQDDSKVMLHVIAIIIGVLLVLLRLFFD